ncbi:MAG: dihydrodipicolinate synthase family protein [Bacteroidales bacterium]|nr:dihydrodipicolinate synthase family protein [Bacteroidales bacterium]
MKALYPLRGIITVLNTPFTATGDVDFSSLKKNIIESLLAGVSGILVPAMASEVNKLTHKERLKIVETALSITNGKVPVFAGLSETDFNQSIKLLKSYLKLGCKQILFQIPYKNEDKFKYRFLKLAELQPEVIMLQDWDSVGYGLPDSLIIDLFEQVEIFRCLKIEVIPAGIKYSRMLDLTNGCLHVSGGWAVTQMIEGLMRGVHAFMPTGMHWIYTEIYNLWEKGKKEKATLLFHKILPVLAFSNQHLDISIHFFKQLLNKQGIYATSNVREPILPFDFVHQQISEKLIDFIIQTENKLKSYST